MEDQLHRWGERKRSLARPHRGTYRHAFVLDPTAVANTLDGVIRAGSSPRTLGLQIPAGHTITAEDVVETGRAMIQFGLPLAGAGDQGR